MFKDLSSMTYSGEDPRGEKASIWGILWHICWASWLLSLQGYLNISRDPGRKQHPDFCKSPAPENPLRAYGEYIPAGHWGPFELFSFQPGPIDSPASCS